MLTHELLIPNKTLIVGSGGRENAIAQTIFRQNPKAEIVTAPGNGDTRFGRTVDVAATDIDGLARLASDGNFGRIIVGPEAPLAKGIVNLSNENGIPIFGPTQEAMKLESDKVDAIRFMGRHGIRFPASVITKNYEGAMYFVNRFYLDPNKPLEWKGLVIKYPGLAGGKGVTIPDDLEEAKKAVKEAFDKYEDTSELIFQERLIGQEFSISFMSDGLNVFPFLPTRDYKKVRDDDIGPNTGGMGSYAPFNISKDIYKQVTDIAQKTVRGSRLEQRPFEGILTYDLIVVDGNANVLEINGRGGDTQTQTNLPMLNTNLLDAFDSSINGNLRPDSLQFDKGFAVTFVIAAGNYPNEISRGAKITLPGNLPKGVILNHAGTKLVDGELQTNGGRILNVTAVRNTVREAREIGNQVSDQVVFEGAYHRTDIAAQAA